MKNSDVIKNVVTYIFNTMEERGISNRELSRMCDENDMPVSDGAIGSMLKKPSSTTISTLLKVCDTLQLNLSSIFHAMEIAKTSDNQIQGKLISNIENPAYNGYTGKYHVFFLPTSADPEDHEEKPLICGTLEFGDIYSCKECSAVLDLDSGDLTRDGDPFKKHYTGRLIYSTNSIMFCNLVCNNLGDYWFLVFDHGNLNNTELACVIGCAATSSSGKPRYPVIHRFCLCNKQKYPEISDATKQRIQGLLRLQNKNIFIKKSTLTEYLERPDLDPVFRRNLENYLNIATEYYAIPKSVVNNELEPSVYSRSIAELCELSALEKAYHIHHSDDRELGSILRYGAYEQKLKNNL